MMASAASCNMCLKANMINHCHGDDTFADFKPIGIFYFLRNREFIFLKMSTASIFFSVPTPYPVKSCWACFQFSHNSICALNSQIKEGKIEGCERSLYVNWSFIFLLFASKWCKWTPFNPLSIQWYLLNIVSLFRCIRSVKISLWKWYIGALCAALVWWKVSNY